ncbi:ATP-dependent helicase [Sphingomonas sp. ABOLF]|nr:ATP-dependent helicase [Sphingomonas sp. ABOLF]
MKNSFSGIRDNRSRGSVHEFVTSTVRPGSKLSIVSAYFTAAAHGAHREALDATGAVRFLFGEPRFLSIADADALSPPAFAITEQGLSLTEQLRARMEAYRCANWIRAKVEVRSVRRAGLLHGKMIHVHDGAREHALIGSSNFTLRGLGFTDKPNLELNLVVDGDRDRADLLAWFDEAWNDDTLTTDVKAEVLARLERLYTYNAPEFIYYKTLFHLFESYLLDQDLEGRGTEALTDSAVWNMLFDFQRDGVRAVLGKLDRHDGCILADSVGLGKTLTALAVVKYFESARKRVLVLAPKKLRENWTAYLSNNAELNPLKPDGFRYDVLSHTDLSRETGHVGNVDLSTHDWSDYDLVVIDESHNFRNAGGSRYRRLIEKALQPGVRTKVLLLSATPVNNDLLDLKAQLDLVAQDRTDAFQPLGVPNLPGLIGDARRKFAAWSARGGRDPMALMNTLPTGLTTLLDGVSIARSRRHIERHYAASLDRIGRFPTRERPQSIFVEIDRARAFPSFAEVDAGISGLKLALYNPFSYVLDEHKARYDEAGRRPSGFDQANRERYLIAMMKVGFLKRLESSIASFGRTMDRMEARIDTRLTDIARLRAEIAEENTGGNEPSDAEELDGDDELAGAFEVGRGLRYDLRHIDVERWATDLAHDRELIAQLAAQAREISPERDAKLAELKALVADKVANPTRNRDGSPNRKLILFTAYTDTAAYLYEQLRPFAQGLGVEVGLVAGSRCEATFGRARFQEVLTNFSPRSKRRGALKALRQDGEIDLLIATDCISEGQNLQDCDRLVNVDIHWNPVRLIQRFGRIDRIGAVADSIRMVNFWPTADLDRYLSLKDRVEARMALVDLSATGEDNLLAEARTAAEADLHWRDGQLRRLQDEVFDLEDAGHGVGLTEFTLDEFRADLLHHVKQHRDALADAPFGLHAIVPSHVEGGRLEPGAIFCLQRRGEPDGGSTKVAPLDPFYLLYVRDDGSIRHGFAQPKTVLNAFQALCVGRNAPIEELCAAFDRETEQGARMERYTGLVEAAVRSITGEYGARALGALAALRGGKLANQEAQPKGTEDFELVTWLVVRAEETR